MSTERRRVMLCRVSPYIPQPPTLATWNPSDIAANLTLSAGNLRCTPSGSASSVWRRCRANLFKLDGSGSVYWETTGVYAAGNDVSIGIDDSSSPIISTNSAIGSIIPGVYEAGLQLSTGRVLYNSSTQNSSPSAVASGTVIRHWYNSDTGVYQIAIGAGAWIPAAGLDGTGAPRLINLTKACPIVALQWTTGSAPYCLLNNGSSPFTYGPPPGATALIVSQPAPLPTPIYLASETFNTLSTDAVPSQEWMARISRATDLTTTREGNCWVWGDQAGVDRGAITVVNSDGFLDNWLTWEWRDALCEMFSGYAGDPYSAFVPYSTDLVDTIDLDDKKQYTLTLASQLAKMDRNIQTVLYPPNVANSNIAGLPIPIVVGQPLYCTGDLLDVSTLARNYQLHDQFQNVLSGLGAYLTGINQIYDRGNVFVGPDDPYTAHTGITSANGGAFGTWSGTPSVPQFWAAATAFGTSNDRFVQGVALNNLRCQSGGQSLTMIYNSSVLHAAASRYVVTFTVIAVTIAGNVRFRLYNAAQPNGVFDVVVNITATGTQSITLDSDPTLSTGHFWIMLGYQDDGIVDVTIDNMTSSTVQIVDWTYYLDGTHRYGFHLANLPQGKIVANPVGPKMGGIVVEYLSQISTMMMNRLWDAYGNSSSVTLDASSVSNLQIQYLYRMAMFWSEPVTFLQAWQDIMDTCCGWILPRRDGTLVVRNVQEPAAVSSLTLDQTNCQSIHIYIDTAPGLSQQISGGKNNSPHDQSDLYSTINDPLSPLYNPALAQALTSDYTITAQGAPLLGPGANPPTSGTYAQSFTKDAKQTVLMDAVTIQQEANRICTLWRQLRIFIDVVCLLNATQADGLEPGDTVTLVWPFNKYLAGGQNFLVKKVTSSFFSRTVLLTLWGSVPQSPASS